MFNQKSGKWSFLIASVLILAACGEVGPSPSLTSSSASSSTPPSSSSISSSSSSSQPPVQYTITFKNYDDSVLSTQTVNQGSTVVYSGPTPTRPSTFQYTYTFTGWDRTLTNITSSFTTKAEFTSTTNTYTVIWQNHDGTTLETDTNVSYGTTPAYNGVTPVRTGSAQYSYSFTGWSPTIANVTGDVTFTAQFAETTNAYTVTWQNHDGTVLETDSNVPYGTTPTFNSSNPTKTSTDDYDYGFTGWLPAIASVTANVTYVAQFTENLNYIPITNAQEFSNIRNNLSGNYRLMNDIDLDSIEWQPIGTATSPFTGTLDGNEFTISNLKITTSQVYVGLFGYNGGLIKNLSLSDVNINVVGGLSSKIYGGAFVGYNSGILENLDTMNGTITIKSRGGNDGYIGGMVGFSVAPFGLINLKNRLDVRGDLTNATGGIFGYLTNLSIASNFLNYGKIVGQSSVGGIGGEFYFNNQDNANLQSLQNYGEINGYSSVGGIFGKSRNLNLRMSTNFGIIKGYLEGNGSKIFGVGGIVGTSDSNLVISSSVNQGNVYGNSGIGGLIGYSAGNILIKNARNLGNILAQSLNNDNNGIGGIAGYIPGNIFIDESFNEGTVSGPKFASLNGFTFSSVGGILGYGNNAIITNSFNSSVIEGYSGVGGLIGYSNFSEISKSFNLGEVLGYSNHLTTVGGIIGYVGDKLYIYNVINLGNVVATDTTTEVGGIAGVLPTTNDIEQTYYSGSITSNGVAVDGVAFGIKVTDLSTFNLAFFTTTLEWDTEIWDFTDLDIVNGVYPTLKNMPEIPVEE
jgi:hypothetical protein